MVFDELFAQASVRCRRAMRTVTMLLFVSLLSLSAAWAQPVSTEQAKQIASQFLLASGVASGGQRRAAAQNALSAAVVFNATDSAGQPYLYAVSAPQNGFVLVSGDERFADVLGYSTTGSFDEQSMPDNMRAFLQGYIDEMRYLDSIGYQPSASDFSVGDDHLEPKSTLQQPVSY